MESSINLQHSDDKFGAYASNSLSISERLDLVENERAILRTLYRYGHSIDYGEEAAWVDCFTVDGVFDAQYSPADDGTTTLKSVIFRGKEELTAFIQQHPRAPKVLHKHLVIDPIIDIAGTSAQVCSYFELLLAHQGSRQIFAFGRYRDTLVRCADGVWRFSLRVAEIQSSGSAFPDAS
jgi:SnoaL-like domain